MASWMFPAFHRQSVSRLKHATEESTPASSSVFCIGNIPADRAEGDIFTLLEHETGTRPERVRLVRDRTTGASQQLAFVDCKNGSSAASAVKSLRTTNTVLDNHTLHAALAPDDLHDLSAPQHAYDWACELPTCAAVNFSRRHECHKCGQKRPLKPQLVEVRLNVLADTHVCGCRLSHMCSVFVPLRSKTFHRTPRVPSTASLLVLLR